MNNLEQDNKIATRSILRNILPAVAVMIAGLIGAYLVYDNYLQDRGQAAQMANLDPASGTPAAAIANNTTTANNTTANNTTTSTSNSFASGTNTTTTSGGGDANPATMQPPAAPASSPAPATAP